MTLACPDSACPFQAVRQESLACTPGTPHPLLLPRAADLIAGHSRSMDGGKEVTAGHLCLPSTRGCCGADPDRVMTVAPFECEGAGTRMGVPQEGVRLGWEEKTREGETSIDGRCLVQRGPRGSVGGRRSRLGALRGRRGRVNVE